MLAALVARAACGVQRETEEDQPDDAGHRCRGLGLRAHPAAERLAAGEERQPVETPIRFGDRGAHGRVRQARRVGSLRAALHERKLVAQGGDAARCEAVGYCDQERMIHSGPGAVRERIDGARPRWQTQQGRDGAAAADLDREFPGWFVAHDSRHSHAARCGRMRLGVFQRRTPRRRPTSIEGRRVQRRSPSRRLRKGSVQADLDASRLGVVAGAGDGFRLLQVDLVVADAGFRAGQRSPPTARALASSAFAAESPVASV